jgi:thioredoxin-like negative regulator of GroEL
VASLTDADFPGKVLHASKTVVVLFSSPTCPTCKVFKPEFLGLAERMREYDVLSIPQVTVFRAGKISERFTAMPIASEIEKALGA